MKLGFKVLVLAALAITFISCSKKGEEQEASSTESVAAVVDGEIISVGQVDRVVAQWRKAGQAPVDASLPINELRKTALTQLVDRMLLHKEAARKGFSADSALVERQLQQFQAQFPTEEARDNALKPMGLDMEGLRKMTEQDLSIQSFIQQEMMPSIDVGEEECRGYFEENPEQFEMPDRIRASHILFLVEETATPEDEAEAQAKATQILERARSGEDFAQLAQEFSEGPSAPRGGDLGYFQRGQMVPPFEAAAFALKVGEISDVVRTRFGYHIIKLVDRQEAGTISYDEAASRVKGFLQQQRLGERIQALIQELREDADIQENL